MSEENKASVFALALTIVLFQYPERTEVATMQENNLKLISGVIGN